MGEAGGSFAVGSWLQRRSALIDEHRRKRGSVAPAFGLGGGSHAGVSARSFAPRTMAERFVGLAKGGQSSVVKLTSYGGAGRLGSMVNYISREGEVAIENEWGQLLTGKDQLGGLRDEWDHLMSDRADSRDIGVFKAEVSFKDGSDRTPDELHADVRDVLAAAYGGRKFVYGLTETEGGKVRVEGLVMLRHADGERLTGDAVANEIVKERFAATEVSKSVSAEFRFGGHGNGVEFGSSRLRTLTDGFKGQVYDQAARPIETHEQANRLMQRQWRDELHSRKARDVMHVMVSARAGTDVEQFRSAARDFLAKQFAGHRYVWAVHDPADDPKDAQSGGKRPHVHAHAVITMRSDYGDRARPTIETFRQWRQGMAEAARSHGIAMEMTDRRELANAPAYTKTQVRPQYEHGRTRHAGTSEAAQVRYERKRTEQPTYPSSEASKSYAERAQVLWASLAATANDRKVSGFANSQGDRIVTAQRESGVDQPSARGSQSGSAAERPQPITRERFEAYEARALAELKRASANIGPEHREAFEKTTKATHQLIEARRSLMEMHEALNRDDRMSSGKGQAAEARSAAARNPGKCGHERDDELLPSSANAKRVEGQSDRNEQAATHKAAEKPAQPSRGRNNRGKDDFELG